MFKWLNTIENKPIAVVSCSWPVYGSLTIGGLLEALLHPGRSWQWQRDVHTRWRTKTHDDSDTYSDNNVLTTTDGVHDAEFFFTVTDDPEANAARSSTRGWRCTHASVPYDSLSGTDIDKSLVWIFATLMRCVVWCYGRCDVRRDIDATSTRRDATRRDATRRDATRRDATRRDATRRDATRRDERCVMRCAMRWTMRWTMWNAMLVHLHNSHGRHELTCCYIFAVRWLLTNANIYTFETLCCSIHVGVSLCGVIRRNTGYSTFELNFTDVKSSQESCFEIATFCHIFHKHTCWLYLHIALPTRPALQISHQRKWRCGGPRFDQSRIRTNLGPRR